MTHPQDCSCDPCLLAHIRAADRAQRQAGWEQWYARDHATIQRYVNQRCHAVHCAQHSDDIVQETFIIGFRNIANGQYQDRGKPLCGYLHGIARNLVHEFARLQNRESVNEELLEMQAADVLALDDTIFLQQVLLFVQEAKARLSEMQQRILDDLYQQGQTSKQVGTALAKSANNIRIMALRALNAIRSYLVIQYHLNLSLDAIRFCLQIM